MDFKNEFSWSKSRDGVFCECKRKYYFNHYGFWDGWKADAPQRVRELYILKNLSTRQIWIGQVVHDIIKYYLIKLKSGEDVTSSHLIFRLGKRLKEDFECSEAGIYKKFPKKCGLVEHEYKMLISKDEWDELFKYAEECIMNFYNSDSLKEIKKEDISRWLFLEEFLSFDFEGTKVYLSIDFAIKDGDNQVILYDWKTGKERDVEMDVQLACYALYVLQKWNLSPDKIIIKKFNVALDKVDEFKVTTQIIEDIKSYMRKSIKDMKDTLKDKESNIAEEGNFSKTSNVKSCLRCNFKKICEIV
ncbi:MAG: PD-(D/E)XK nuclease family protein [Nanoarchaeota archaeon]|nr:PD-(D/E)XK nuclease family protein [Nanoarchaeota archaeon]